MTSIEARLGAVRDRVATAARAAGRDPDDITLVVVTKSVGADEARVVIEAGALDLGENQAQELVAKAAALTAAAVAPRWHFIGRLQRNKVRALAPHVACWQSVDRVELADEIGRRAPAAVVLVQVNVSGEAQKGGCAPSEARGLVEACTARGLRVDGLMTVPPAAGDPVPHFRRLRALTDELGLRTCSMGMSGDFELAIGCGATMVRVGSAIFGPRPEGDAARR